jgi:hypothetical protein
MTAAGPQPNALASPLVDVTLELSAARASLEALTVYVAELESDLRATREVVSVALTQAREQAATIRRLTATIARQGRVIRGEQVGREVAA